MIRTIAAFMTPLLARVIKPPILPLVPAVEQACYVDSQLDRFRAYHWSLGKIRDARSPGHGVDHDHPARRRRFVCRRCLVDSNLRKWRRASSTKRMDHVDSRRFDCAFCLLSNGCREMTLRETIDGGAVNGPVPPP